MESDAQLLIDGSAREGSDVTGAPVVNPATGESIGQVALPPVPTWTKR